MFSPRTRNCNFVTASYDTDPINPHEEYGTIELVTTKNRYFWGDITCDDPRTELDSRREIGQEFVALPLFLYAHSGISISVLPYHDQWDSGQIGYAICTKQNVIDQFGTDENWQQTAQKLIRDEIRAYDDYLTGPSYVYDVYVYDTDTGSWEHHDSCRPASIPITMMKCLKLSLAAAMPKSFRKKKARELYEL